MSASKGDIVEYIGKDVGMIERGDLVKVLRRWGNKSLYLVVRCGVPWKALVDGKDLKEVGYYSAGRSDEAN